MTVILFSSAKVFRSLAYEFFLHLHIVLMIVALIFLWTHLEGLPQRGLLLSAVMIWAVSRALRFATLLFRSFGNGGSSSRLDVKKDRDDMT